MGKAHKNGKAVFEELDYAEQAKSINVQMLDLESAIKANIKKAFVEGRDSPEAKRIINLKDVIKRIEEFTTREEYATA
jgi:hypothetical protein